MFVLSPKKTKDKMPKCTFDELDKFEIQKTIINYHKKGIAPDFKDIYKVNVDNNIIFYYDSVMLLVCFPIQTVYITT